MENFTVRSFFEDRVGNIVNESYLGSIDECKIWSYYEYKHELKPMYFEIHHSLGALTYFKATVYPGKSIFWKEIEYEQQDIPLICPWWKITELPSKLR